MTDVSEATNGEIAPETDKSSKDPKPSEEDDEEDLFGDDGDDNGETLANQEKTEEDVVAEAPVAAPEQQEEAPGDEARTQAADVGAKRSPSSVPRKQLSLKTTADLISSPPQAAPTSQFSALTSPGASMNAKYGLPMSVKIPASVTPELLNGKLLATLRNLPPNLINDALTEYDDAVVIKGEAIRSHGAYLYGVVKRYCSVHERSLSGEGSGILPMGEGLTPVVLTRLDNLVSSGFCTEEEMNDKVKSKIRMLSERDALFALDELASVDRSSIRNFGSYFMGILNRYMRGDTESKRRPSHPPAQQQQNRGRDRNYRESAPPVSSYSRDRSRDRYDGDQYGPRDLGASPMQQYDQRQNPRRPWMQQPPDRMPPMNQPDRHVVRTPPGFPSLQQPQQSQYPGMQPQQLAPPPPQQQQQQQNPMYGQQQQNSFVQQSFQPPGVQQPPPVLMTQQQPPNPNFYPQQHPYGNSQQAPPQYGTIQQQPPPFGAPQQLYMGNQPQQQQYMPPIMNQTSQQQQPQQLGIGGAPGQLQQHVVPGGYPGAPAPTAWQQQQQQPLQQPQVPFDILGLADKAASAVQALASQSKQMAPPAYGGESSNAYSMMRSQNTGQIQLQAQSYTAPSMYPPVQAGLPASMPYQQPPAQPQAAPMYPSGGDASHRRRTTATLQELPIMVQYSVNNLQATGSIDGDLDAGMLGMIHDLPEPMALAALQRFEALDKTSMRNRTAYLAGLLRRELEKINRR